MDEDDLNPVEQFHMDRFEKYVRARHPRLASLLNPEGWPNGLGKPIASASGNKLPQPPQQSIGNPPWGEFFKPPF